LIRNQEAQDNFYNLMKHLCPTTWYWRSRQEKTNDDKKSEKSARSERPGVHLWLSGTGTCWQDDWYSAIEYCPSKRRWLLTTNNEVWRNWNRVAATTISMVIKNNNEQKTFSCDATMLDKRLGYTLLPNAPTLEYYYSTTSTSTQSILLFDYLLQKEERRAAVHWTTEHLRLTPYMTITKKRRRKKKQLRTQEVSAVLAHKGHPND